MVSNLDKRLYALSNAIKRLDRRINELEKQSEHQKRLERNFMKHRHIDEGGLVE